MRKLATALDHKKIMEFVNQERTFNTFIIGDIECYGYDNDFQKIYFDMKLGEIKSVLLIYYNNAVFYSKETQDITIYLDIIKEFNIQYLTGKKQAVKAFADVLKDFICHNTYLLAFKNNPMDFNATEEIIHAKSKDEIRENVKLRQEIVEFSQVNDIEGYVNRTYQNTLNHSHLTVYIRKDNKVVSSASISPFCKEIGMVVAVMTHPNYRNRGYARQLIHYLTKFAFSRQMELSLFYDNEVAGRLYKSLGFIDIGEYSMLSKN